MNFGCSFLTIYLQFICLGSPRRGRLVPLIINNCDIKVDQMSINSLRLLYDFNAAAGWDVLLFWAEGRADR